MLLSTALSATPVSTGQIIFCLFLRNLLFLLLMINVASARKQDLFSYTNLKLTPRCNSWWKALLYGMLTFLVILVVRIVLLLLLPRPQQGVPAGEFLASLTSWQFLLLALDIALCVPFLEEMLNRALVMNETIALFKWQTMFSWLRNEHVASGIAIVFSAVLFGLMHNSLPHLVPYTAAGLVMGMVYSYTGSLWPSVIAHMVNNFLACIALALLR
jgi:membrane protease YdiL (CAAX protease family)